MNGNISASPDFCDPANANYYLSSDSPCLPENSPCMVLIGAFGQGCGATGVPADPRGSLSLSWSVPNPFRPGWSIDLHLPVSGVISLAIHDASGRLVRHLLAAPCQAGDQHLRWDGRNDAGHPMPSGIYFCRLQAGGQAAVRKTLLLE